MKPKKDRELHGYAEDRVEARVHCYSACVYCYNIFREMLFGDFDHPIFPQQSDIKDFKLERIVWCELRWLNKLHVG